MTGANKKGDKKNYKSQKPKTSHLGPFSVGLNNPWSLKSIPYWAIYYIFMSNLESLRKGMIMFILLCLWNRTVFVQEDFCLTSLKFFSLLFKWLNFQVLEDLVI